MSVHSCTFVHFQHSVCIHSSRLSGKLDTWYFAVLKRRKTAEHAKLLADLVKESAKRKFKILEKDLEKEKIEKKRLK